MKYFKVKSVSVGVMLIITFLFIPATISKHQEFIPYYDQPDLSTDTFLSNLSCNKTIWDEITHSWVDPLKITAQKTIRFNITLTNKGENLISEISIRDLFPLSLTYAGNATIPETIILDQTIYWNLTTDLFPGETFFVEFDADLTTDDQFLPTIIMNNVTVTANECSIGQIIVYDTATLIIQFNKLCEKQVWDQPSGTWRDNTTAELGDTIRFRITISYWGEYTLYNIRVKDMLPDGLTYADNADPVPTAISGQNIYWNLSISLHDGENYTIQFDALVEDDGVMVNVIEMIADECSGDVRYCTDDATIQVNQVPKICEKQVYNPTYGIWVDDLTTNIGDLVSFRITISYHGDYTLYNIHITDVLPDGIIYADNANIQPTAITDQKVYWNLTQTLQDGEYLTIKFDGLVISDGIQTNLATVTAKECSGNTWTCCDIATVTVEEGCKICDKKIWDTDTETWVEEITADIGDTIRFRITISYWGNYTLYNIKITDILPDGLIYADNAVPLESGISGQTIYWNLSVHLTKGESSSVEFDATVTEEGMLVNFVSVRANECSGQIKYCTDSAIVDAQEAYDLFADAGGPYLGYKGVPIQFTGTVTGGQLPYSYIWYFDDGSTSHTKNPSHIYSDPGDYFVTFLVTDYLGYTRMDMANVTINQDIHPPQVEFIQPLDQSLYIRNTYISWFVTTLIIGDFDVQVTAYDNETDIAKVTFYIDDTLKNTDTTAPYSWNWMENRFGRYNLRIVAEDLAGNSNIQVLPVWKFF